MTMTDANSIVRTFRAFHKQLALLREYQRQCYGMEYAFIITCDWGTQYGVLASLKRSKDALRAFARDSTAECGSTIIYLIGDYSFWSSVDELIDLWSLFTIRRLHLKAHELTWAM